MLYKRWVQSNIPLKGFNLEYAHIDVKTELSYEEFHKNYYSIGRPVLIKGGTKQWKANTEWKREKLIEKYGEIAFDVNKKFYNEEKKKYKSIRMKLKEYFDYCDTNKDKNPLYVFDSKFGSVAPSMLDEYTRPHYFREDFFSVMGPHRPPYRWLVLGPQRSGSSFHIDPMNTSAWNALVCIIFYF